MATTKTKTLRGGTTNETLTEIIVNEDVTSRTVPAPHPKPVTVNLRSRDVNTLSEEPEGTATYDMEAPTRATPVVETAPSATVVDPAPSPVTAATVVEAQQAKPETVPPPGFVQSFKADVLDAAKKAVIAKTSHKMAAWLTGAGLLTILVSAVVLGPIAAFAFFTSLGVVMVFGYPLEQVFYRNLYRAAGLGPIARGGILLGLTGVTALSTMLGLVPVAAVAGFALLICLGLNAGVNELRMAIERKAMEVDRALGETSVVIVEKVTTETEGRLRTRPAKEGDDA